MLNFNYCNPTRIVFGRGTIAQLSSLIPAKAKILMTYGGGSIRQNGVYEQVNQALADRAMVEFGGIEANPRYETLLRAVELGRKEKVDFLLAVGGGSIVDGTKFIAAAMPYEGKEPWDLMRDWSLIRKAVPIGCVLTLPATGSEMNNNAVVSRESTHQKLHFTTDLVLPQFSILDPETTFSLPPRQSANGVIDTFVHVFEQYLTYPAAAPLQDRMAEGILQTLVEEAPKVLANPRDYNARANLMWCATLGLNGLIGCGVPQDWASHMIGHELTALYGIDHGRTLALVAPLVMRHQRDRKRQKLLQYGARVWGLTDGDEKSRIDGAIARTEAFFQSLGVSTRLADHGVPAEAAALVAQRLADRKMLLGEHQDLGRKEVEAILTMGM
jgi:NADP-dependent alcohol dehydrogenase